ncbi:MAG: hypothetical protein NPIRA03_23650 [Nitrospirales bacterium]|nr:MAG: hypothetical protein NPIRA03_23650 [Nitrospirales bacterium]
MGSLSEEKVFRGARMNLESPVSDERHSLGRHGLLIVLNGSTTCIPLSISNEMKQPNRFQTLSDSVESSRVTHVP